MLTLMFEVYLQAHRENENEWEKLKSQSDAKKLTAIFKADALGDVCLWGIGALYGCLR